MKRYLPALFVVIGVASCSDSPGSTSDGDDVAVIGDTDGDTGGSIDTDIPDVAETGDDVAPDVGDDTPAPDVGEDTPAPDTGEDTTIDVAPGDCAADQCDIDGECYDNQTPNPDNPCEVCLVVTARDTWTPDDAATCDDGDACTVDDHCFEGTCMGTVSPCDDGDPCTAGTCDPETGECTTAPAEGPCTDGDPCTIGDMCADGVCVGGSTGPSCDDGNPCTADACEEGVGCVSTPLDGAACDDGNVCTVGDMCAAGVCVAGADPLDCDDGSVCTIDRCDPVLGCSTVSIADRCVDDNPCTDEMCDDELGCVYPFNNNPCDDGTECTEADACLEGVCVGLPVIIDDGELCTDDVCDPVLGPISTPNTDPCDDGNACTVGDVCTDGGCESGTTPLDCSDTNVCTDEACDPAEGCVVTFNTAACDDNNACTIDDVCGDGSCGGTEITCDDGNACTADSCDPIDGCSFDLIRTNDCRPQIVVTYPPRGATIEQDLSDTTITVTGTVTSGAGAITTFTINGEDVTVAGDGSFEHDITATPGGNILFVDAEDELGSERNVVQSFLLSDTYLQPDAANPNVGRADPGLAIGLSQGALDELSFLFGAVLQTFDIGSLLAGGDGVITQFSFLFITYTVSIDDRVAQPVTFGTPDVAVLARDGGLRFEILIPNVHVDLRISGFGCNGDVDFDAPLLTIVADTSFAVVDNALTATADDVQVRLSYPGNPALDPTANVGCLPGSIAEGLIADFYPELETTFADALRDALPPILADAFNAFALDIAFPFPRLDNPDETVDISLQTDFTSTDFHPGFGTFYLRAGAYATQTTPYTNLGSLGRSGCGLGPQTMQVQETDEIEIGLADDTLNLLFHAAWYGGLLEFDVPPELLGDFDLTAFGVTNLDLRASGLLAPTASDCNEAGELRLMIGDIRIDASLELFGVPLDFVIYASLEASLNLTAGPDGIGFGIGDLVSYGTEVTVQQEDAVAAEATVAALIEAQLVPALLGALGGDSLASFPLPAFDLSESVPGLPPGSVLAIEPTGLVRDSGNTYVLGVLADTP